MYAIIETGGKTSSCRPLEITVFVEKGLKPKKEKLIPCIKSF